MSDKSDHDLLVEIHTDVKWMKDESRAYSVRLDKVENEMGEVKKQIWTGAGLIASVVGFFEFFKDKIFK